VAQEKAAPPTGKETGSDFVSSKCIHVIIVAPRTSGMPRELHSVIKVKGKGDYTLEEAVKSEREGRDISLLFL
jgi:hypothetical protein